MTSTITATFKCRDCGSAIRWDGDLDDNQTVCCSSCTKPVGTLADLKAITREAARKEAIALVRKAFKRR